MEPQTNPHAEGSNTTPERRFDRSPRGLECLRCRHVFEAEDLARIRSSDQELSYIQCAWCDARNEVRAVPRPGLGIQPAAVIVRIMNERL
jgi:hypothetical protein